MRDCQHDHEIEKILWNLPDGVWGRTYKDDDEDGEQLEPESKIKYDQFWSFEGVHKVNILG